MAEHLTREARRSKRHGRIRGKIHGTQQRPRLCVFRSLKHMYAQLVDDNQGGTILAVCTVKLDGRKLKNGGSVEAAKKVGETIAKKAVEKGIETVVFDRSGYLYHGRVKALAEAARKMGLKF
ncbi:50S ribosomal protein L18 [Acidobacteria bacterium AH-259-A15]|nr:50S ribosomal protein L18 [Acidobacteria bacterium AH-259-A15]